MAWSWPLPLHLSNRFTHDPGDPLLVTYLIWWNAHAIPLTSAYWNAPYFWPMRDALALTEHLAGLSPVTTPLQWLGASPLTAYNLVLIASSWWTALATHAVVRRLGGSVAAAAIAGVAFAYAPYRTSQIGHLQLYACWWLPLMLLALHAYYQDRRARWLWLLGLAWVLQGLTTGYYLLFTPVLIGAWLVWFTRRREAGAAARVLLTLAVSALTVLPFLLEYRSVQAALGLSRSADEMAGYSAALSSFVSATPMLRFWHTAEPTSTEQYLFPGVTALALALGGLVYAGRDRRYWFYAAAAALMAWLCAGPAVGAGAIGALTHPYTWLGWLPGYQGLRVPSRFFMLAALCLAIAGALAFDAVAGRLGRWRPLAIVLVFAGLAFDGAIAGMPLGVPPSRLTLSERDARVMVLPFAEGRVSVFAMYQSMSHGLPVVNGYAGYVPPHAAIIDWALRRGDPSVLTELRRGHPLYVLVAFTPEAPEWTAFMDGQQPATLLGISGGGRLYLMPPAPYAHEPRPGVLMPNATVAVDGTWMTADLGEPRTARGLELLTRGNVRLPATIVAQTSVDGVTWTTVFDEPAGGLMLRAALRSPLGMPIRIDLGDAAARYVRLNTPGFHAAALTLYQP